MHSLPTLSVSLLLLTLAACSSGSSSEPESQTSNNTVTTETHADDQLLPSVPLSTDEMDTEVTTIEPSTPDDNSDNGMNEEIEDASASDDATSSDNSELTVPIGTPDSNLAIFEASVKLLVGQSLLALNQSLTSGELLSAQQEECIGSFDPALGEPLLAINCEQPLSINNVPIFAKMASFNNTPDCVADLQNITVTNCTVAQAELTVNTLWTIPATEPGQPERPQPAAGAFINYGVDPGRLVIENLPAALAGVFRCEYDLVSGAATSTSAAGDCESQLTRLKDLIDDHLATVIN